MLLYVSTGDPGDHEARPLHTIPDTVPKLYDLGMREHARASVLTFRDGAEWVETPDWRFDREVIRLALYCRERLHLDAAERVAIFGPAGRLWLAADFAIQCLGSTAVGISHFLSDDQAAAAVREAGARIVFATDEESARRLLALPSLPLAHVIAPLASGDDRVVPLRELMALADTLDTAERAQQFRTRSRAVTPDDPALWHCEPGTPVVRLTQRGAMERVRDRLLAQPARSGDCAWFQSAGATLAARLAGYGFVGDGQTTTVIGPSDLAEVTGLRPARVLANAAWIEELATHLESSPRGRWEDWAGTLGLGGLSRHLRRSRLRRVATARLGDGLRSLESLGPLPPATARLLLEAGVPLSPPSPDSGTPTSEARPEITSKPQAGGPHLRPAT